jgi:hypothetical protein
MNHGSGSGYLRSETTLRQPSQRNIRSAGCVPELRWSAKCFICAPQPLQTRAGASCGLVAVSIIADEWQQNRVAAVQFETFSKKNRQPREFPCRRRQRRLTRGRGLHGPRGDRMGCLRWCDQLTPKPRVRSWGPHWVNQLGHSLVDVIASGALKRPDIKARGAGCNPHQHRCCLAPWTYRSGIEDHDRTPLPGGSATELSVTGICRVGAVMQPASNFRNSAAVPFCSHSKNNQRIVRELRHSPIQIRTIA